MLLPWQREWVPDAGRNKATGRIVLSLLPSWEYHGPDYEPGVPNIYMLRRQFFADIIELHVFRSTEAIIPPPDYEVVARVERDAAGNWLRWTQKAVERCAARTRPGVGIPFGPERISYESGLYLGPVLLYRAEEAGGFNFRVWRHDRGTSPWRRQATSSFSRSPGCCGAGQRSARRR
jgi:hypothetical protein